VPLCVFAVPAVCAEVAFCDAVVLWVFVAEVVPVLAAGFAGVAGLAAGVELSVAAGALAAGGVVDGFVAGVCCAAADPAKKRVVANRLIAMLGSFRMDLVSQRFAGCANGVNRGVCSVIRGLPADRSRRRGARASRIHWRAGGIALARGRGWVKKATKTSDSKMWDWRLVIRDWRLVIRRSRCLSQPHETAFSTQLASAQGNRRGGRSAATFPMGGSQRGRMSRI